MWEKQGLIFSCDKYGTGYAQDPFIDVLNDDVWRIYYSTRTKNVISMPFCIDVEAKCVGSISTFVICIII